MKIGVHKIAMAAPNDVSGLKALIDAGAVDPASIVAVIGKTEGNGGANDFTRGFATLSFQLLLAPLLGTTPDDVGARIAFVWSGGTEGVLSPHATIFTRVPGVPAQTPRLALGIAVTRELAAEEIGRMAMVEVVADAVRRCLADTGITDPSAVHYVQVKGPLLTPARITEARARGAALATEDPNGSKTYARGAMGLGVALGLGEVSGADLSDAVIARRLDLFSSVASTSAGGELKNCEVLLFGNSASAGGDLRIGHAVLADAIDADGVRAALASAGLDVSASVGREDAGRIAAVFAKAEASPTGKIRGWRNTMLSDADINYERHARAALGAVIASVTNDPAIFVSGGTEHQCAPGMAPIAAIVRV
ncbi:ring-opening amidohydrolase [Bradyrhizobium prioriisuperbiae]|uniref:cyanuric acid amidohydrolase n=1 Tax=Bradyrhizobium prioriisuperbiae TaxID=2854389 RepID=UPI0028E1E0B5|nr:ring-opening amidohydrolase [Bradyrhizobium prioritasuperba]